LPIAVLIWRRTVKLKLFVYHLAIGAALFVGYTSVYRVGVGQQAVVTQFDRIIGEPRTEPGFYWRIPFAQSVHYLPHRDIQWNGPPLEISTRDKAPLCVEAIGGWRVVDPIIFFQRVGSASQAMSHIEGIISPAVRIVITSYRFREIVHNKTGPKALRTCRSEIIEEIVALARPHLRKLGIELTQFEVLIL
jgi:modulator of FtsH protease HflC